MVKNSLSLGSVNAISPSGVSIRLASGEVIIAKNLLGARCPPGSTVTIVRAHNGSYGIVGRRR